jgi:hypothetical protein
LLNNSCMLTMAGLRIVNSGPDADRFPRISK